MSLLANLTTDDSIENEKDVVMSGGPMDSGAYRATVSMAYLTESQGGAVGLVLHFKTEGGRELRQTLWMTSGKAKGKKNYYEKDGQKHYLPGFNNANSLSLLTIGKEISSLEPEIKVVNVYSPEAKAEVPTKVECLVELLNQEIVVGVIKQVVDKTQKDDSGTYQPTGETREENEIDKFFRARDLMTTAEIRAKAEEATFHATWVSKWEGQVRQRAKGAQGNNGTAGALKASGSSSKPTTSLFA